MDISIGETNAINPNIIPRLNIFEPITFPTEIECLSWSAADIVTANSGAEVAIATIVNPITRSESPNLFAIFEDESTIHEAPPQRPTTENPRIIILKKMGHLFYLKNKIKDKLKKGFYKI